MRNGKPVILYIDDDAEFLDSVRLILESNGFMVDSAPSAEEGLRKFKKERPDLIVVDLMMEEVDSGTNFVKEMKLLNNTAPIYLLSSAGDQLSMTTNYADLGLDGIFQKPLHPEKLLSTIKSKLKLS